MSRKMLWGLLALVLSAPAVWAGTKMATGPGAVPCEDCQEPCPDCPDCPFGR